MELFRTTKDALKYEALAASLPSGALRAFNALKVPDDMPFFLDGEGGYPAIVNAWLRDLPAWGSPAKNTWWAYARDLQGAMMHLAGLDPPKTLLDARYEDMKAYRNARRNGDEPAVTAATWNRAVAALESFYGWARAHGHRAEPPFRYVRKRVGRNGSDGMADVNSLYESGGTDDLIKCVSLADYRIFRNVGLRGMLPDQKTRDPDFDRRNGERNAAMADLLLNTGMRVTEFISVLRAELPPAPAAARGRGATAMRVASYTAKRRKGRTVLAPNRLLAALGDYAEVDRATAVLGARERGTYRPGRRWQPMRPVNPRVGALLSDGGSRAMAYEIMNPALRRRLMVTDDHGEPVEPAILWLGEDGRPMSYDNVRMTFTRASERCETLLKRPFKVTPHTLRHTFAVHMLSFLIREHLQIDDFATLRDHQTRLGADGFRGYALNPLRVLKSLLGHKSVETTFGYLTHMVDVRRFEASATLAFDAELVDAGTLARAAQSFGWDGGSKNQGASL